MENIILFLNSKFINPNLAIRIWLSAEALDTNNETGQMFRIAASLRSSTAFLVQKRPYLNASLKEQFGVGSSNSGSADWYHTKAAPNCSRADGVVPFRMERVALNVEPLHLGIAD